MTTPGNLTIAASGEQEILLTRHFDAPPNLVFDAYTKPELLRRWLGVRAGWVLAVCEVDLRVGGRYRWVWRNQAKGVDMGCGGTYLEIVAGEKLVCTERFDTPWYPGEARNTVHFEAAGTGTFLRTVLRYESRESRDLVLQSPMDRGLNESYQMLDTVLAG